MGNHFVKRINWIQSFANTIQTGNIKWIQSFANMHTNSKHKMDQSLANMHIDRYVNLNKKWIQTFEN